MVNVSWNDAVAFCKWLSKKEGKTYRLPTEAEWEYACRAGTTTRYYSGDDPETLAKVGNVADAAAKAKFPDWRWTIKANDGYVFTAPVGKFKPNAFGLYDMHGNAWQWCADWYGEEYYAKSPVDDPTGPDTGDFRVLRGGFWGGWPNYTRSATRVRDFPVVRIYGAQASVLPGLSNAMASGSARYGKIVRVHSTANTAYPLRRSADAARRTRLPLGDLNEPELRTYSFTADQSDGSLSVVCKSKRIGTTYRSCSF